MLLKLIVASLAIASVTGQGCTNGLAGRKDLCCYDPTQYLGCYVAGDPMLTSFQGFKISLDFPCGTMISSSQADTAQCVVNVFAASKQMRTGAIFTSQVKIQLRQLVIITLTINFDNSPPQILIERSDSDSQTVTLSSGQQSLNQDGIQGDLLVNYDQEKSLVTVDACKISVNVRPATGDNPLQTRVPGLCVVQPVGSRSPNPSSTNSCSLREDLTNTPISQYLETAIQPMKNYMFNSGILRQTTSSQNTAKCKEYQDILVDKCEAADRFNAMKKCAPILFHSNIRRCFYEAEKSGSVMGAFLHCLDTYCQGTKELCTALKNYRKFQKCDNTLLNCETWPPYRRVNRFVAGEGEGINFGTGNDDNQETETTWSPLVAGGILGTGNQDQNDQDAGGIGGGFNPGDLF